MDAREMDEIRAYLERPGPAQKTVARRLFAEVERLQAEAGRTRELLTGISAALFGGLLEGQKEEAIAVFARLLEGQDRAVERTRAETIASIVEHLRGDGADDRRGRIADEIAAYFEVAEEVVEAQNAIAVKA